MLPLFEQPCCCCGGGAVLTGEEEDVSIHCAAAAAGVVVVGVGTEGENMDGAADDEGSLRPAEICSAFRMRSGCCRSLRKRFKIESWRNNIQSTLWNVRLVVIFCFVFLRRLQLPIVIHNSCSRSPSHMSKMLHD